MDEDEYICPQGWRWSTIYESLRTAWRGSGDADMAEPHLLPPNASDMARKHRWEETLQWADENGFTNLIPELPEDERYYRMTYA